MEVGHVMVVPTGRVVGNPKYIINFPTKRHWRSKSKITDIRDGLSDLADQIREFGIQSIAVPPLGCGNGGLRWSDVRPLIMDVLGQLADVEVHLFAPDGAPASSSMRVATGLPKLTRVRAAILSALDGYVGPFGCGATPIEVQKIAYFLERFGEPLDLRFVKARYGPYSERLTHVIDNLEGHYVTGFGDRSKPVAEAEPLRVLESSRSTVESFLKDDEDARRNVESTLALLDGFDSTYGTELLSTVDWAVTQEGASGTVDDVARIVEEWNRRKARLFTRTHIARALEQLRTFELIP
jgi:O-acetyl-ADP-ribose deacetylase (regulator of RNase III)